MERLSPDSGDWWYQHIYDQAKEDGEAKGFRIDDISFTGFWSQGDGASWEGMVDMVKWLELNKPNEAAAIVLIELIENGWFSKQLSITRIDSRYSHSHTMAHGCWECVAPTSKSVMETGILQGANVKELCDSTNVLHDDSLLRDVVMDARSFADDIYEQLRKEYEYLCSEEHIVELCDANDYLFDENGKFI